MWPRPDERDHGQRCCYSPNGFLHHGAKEVGGGARIPGKTLSNKDHGNNHSCGPYGRFVTSALTIFVQYESPLSNKGQFGNRGNGSSNGYSRYSMIDQDNSTHITSR